MLLLSSKIICSRQMRSPHLISQKGELTRISSIIVIQNFGFAGSCSWCLDFFNLQCLRLHWVLCAFWRAGCSSHGMSGVQCKNIGKPEEQEAHDGQIWGTVCMYLKYEKPNQSESSTHPAVKVCVIETWGNHVLLRAAVHDGTTDAHP